MLEIIGLGIKKQIQFLEVIRIKIKFMGKWHPFNGNDILEAVKIMESRGDLKEFEYFARDRWNEVNPKERVFFYILQNFFPLMAEWLKERNK